MDYKKLFNDCIKTPPLWIRDSIYNLDQFLLEKHTFSFDKTIPQKLRLGKLVEQFICFQLEQGQSIELLIENYQVQNGKLTIGELDCLFLQNEKPIHLEIIYKFYLYDETVGVTELEHWIGPNRKDSLIQKLNKLKNKQLPLLFNRYTKPLLDSLKLNADSIEQKVCFKAQLFIPFGKEKTNYNQINKDCIKGFYLNKSELNNFNDCKFYIPEKIDWLLETTTNVSWKMYSEFYKKITDILENKTSPMVWIKKSNGTLLKCFVVWW